MIYLILGFFALGYLICRSTFEHMTNSDVRKKLNHHKTAETWDSVEDPEKDAKDKNPIKGPNVRNKHGRGAYPDIYGPDILLEPGYKDSDFLPMNEFPAGPDAPEPYLPDFSSFLKM